jgi:hypothetical protein
MKTELSKENQVILDKAIQRTHLYLQSHGTTNFEQFYLNFIRGFSGLVLIGDKKFKEIINEPDDIEMADNALQYIQNLKEDHPIYNYFRQYISFPSFMQEDIMLNSIHIISELSKRENIF